MIFCYKIEFLKIFQKENDINNNSTDDNPIAIAYLQYLYIDSTNN